MVAHSVLTGSDLHEPKGASSASSEQVYVADGASGGVWTDLTSAIGTNINSVGLMQWTEVAVNQSDLASSGTKTLISSSGSEQYKLREIYMSEDGTAFSGGTGDRLMAITDGTSTWTLTPAASLQTLAWSRWGDTALPKPATDAHFNTASAAGVSIYATYSGGSNDYTAGELTLILGYERTA